MRTPLMAGNWKMHLNRREAKILVEDLRKAVEGTTNEVLLCPPNLLLDTVQVGFLVSFDGDLRQFTPNL